MTDLSSLDRNKLCLRLETKEGLRITSGVHCFMEIYIFQAVALYVFISFT